MRRSLTAFMLLALLPSLFVFTSQSYALTFTIVTFRTDKGLVHVKAEVAETPAEKQQGLMFRTSLPEDAGMLFVFDSDQPLTFWMMNTIIALDGIFISSSMRVVFVAENLKPCPPDPCQNPQTFSTPVPARFVLEVNAGFAARHGIRTGTEVAIHYEIDRPQVNATQLVGIVALVVLAVIAILSYRKMRRDKAAAGQSL